MRIERINENSIRCTLTSFDLSVRNLNLRELAYGTDKAKKLFDEMMKKASAEVGFDAENTPIMIEAIPLSGDSIQLVITKVEDPEELDTRFSKFSHAALRKSPMSDLIRKFASELLEGADGLLSQVQKLDLPDDQKGIAPVTGQSAVPQSAQDNSFRVFAFEKLDEVITAAGVASFFKGYSSLYKRTQDGSYVLVIFSAKEIQEDFSKVCNIIAEYGRQMSVNEVTLSYFDEHYQLIINGSALQKLSKL